MKRKGYAIKKQAYSLTHGGYLTYTMGKDGSFYLALGEGQAPQLDTVKEARTFFYLHAHKHHKPHDNAWIEGSKGGIYTIPR